MPNYKFQIPKRRFQITNSKLQNFGIRSLQFEIWNLKWRALLAQRPLNPAAAEHLLAAVKNRRLAGCHRR